MGQTLIEKIIASHSGRDVKPGDIANMVIDFRVARDFGGANVVRNLQEHGLKIADAAKTAFTFDCNPTGSDQKYAAHQQLCRVFAKQHDIPVSDIDKGIGTHLAIENGWIGPGGTLVSTDSHANILGAIGAFGQGMGDVDIAAAFAKGQIWFKTPPSVKITVKGSLPQHCTAKDLTLYFLQQFGANGLLGAAAEVYGPAIEALDLHERITLASMATEMGAVILLISPSDAVIDTCRTAGAAFEPVYADADAVYQRELSVNIANLEPMLSRPGHPDDAVPVSEAEGTPVHSVFIGSCTNGRFEDLRAAAAVLEGKRKAPHVVLKIVPATDAVWQRCLREGVFDTFKQAGALIGNAGCAGCAAGQVGQNGPGEVTVSTGNRNFAGKQGKGEVYLASPATAAAAAVAGCLVSADRLNSVRCRDASAPPLRQPAAKRSGEQSGKPTVIKGRVWVIRQDHIDTDMIYHNRYLTVTELNDMGPYTFENLDGWGDFAKKAEPGHILVTGDNFGCGSSRQQAVDCFKSLGIPLIIARSFGAIYERNAINNGLAITTADLVNTDIQDGEVITCDLASGTIVREAGEIVKAAPFSEVQMQIYQRGGLL
ncbi:MAG: aconitase/3-isopropylmalate dehydratase large subunit family protein [candidate division KSB1 bacterium]|nr:aconitase/3-isopropylmalate dehydratase large subunit family protein [candidate division KSB1 bacterium]